MFFSYITEKPHIYSNNLHFPEELICSLQSPDIANLQPAFQTGAKLEPALPFSWIRYSRARKTAVSRKPDLPSVKCFHDILHLTDTLTITVMEWNYLPTNSFIVILGRTTIDHIEIWYIVICRLSSKVSAGFRCTVEC